MGFIDPAALALGLSLAAALLRAPGMPRVRRDPPDLLPARRETDRAGGRTIPLARAPGARPAYTPASSSPTRSHSPYSEASSVCAASRSAASARGRFGSAPAA